MLSPTGPTDQETHTQKNVHTRSYFFVFESLAIFLFLLLPMSINTGLFSSMVGFASKNEDGVLIEKVDNSANYTSLLSATRNADPIGAIGGGGVLVLDGVLISSGPIGEDDIAASNSNSGEISVYVVREGDSLSQIAEMYGVTTNTILWANDITSASSIQPGDTLVILPVVGIRHTVAKGETLGTILKKYDADLEEVLDYNNLASADSISVGDDLIIPGGNIKTVTKIASRPAPTKSSGFVTSTNLLHPIPGAVRTQGIHGYNGVDLAAPYGKPIRAAASGEVIVSKNGGWNGGYGTYVVIRHSNGTQTLYAHNSSNAVSVGQKVSAGQTIAYIGSTGRSTGNHVHFEVRGGKNPF